MFLFQHSTHSSILIIICCYIFPTPSIAHSPALSSNSRRTRTISVASRKRWTWWACHGPKANYYLRPSSSLRTFTVYIRTLRSAPKWRKSSTNCNLNNPIGYEAIFNSNKPNPIGRLLKFPCAFSLSLSFFISFSLFLRLFFTSPLHPLLVNDCWPLPPTRSTVGTQCWHVIETMPNVNNAAGGLFE